MTSGATRGAAGGAGASASVVEFEALETEFGVGRLANKMFAVNAEGAEINLAGDAFAICRDAHGIGSLLVVGTGELCNVYGLDLGAFNKSEFNIIDRYEVGDVVLIMEDGLDRSNHVSRLGNRRLNLAIGPKEFGNLFVFVHELRAACITLGSDSEASFGLSNALDIGC